MNIVNLTPHEIKIYAGDTLLREVPPSGQIARCAEERKDLMLHVFIRQRPTHTFA
jgi:hypothetical protein